MPEAKILVVEDEKSIVKVLKYNLEKAGYQVIAAYDGETGLSCFREVKPDLVILDIMLPQKDGFDFCKAVRQSSRTPILMLTARKDELDRVLGFEIGADDYVTKPFSVREVLARVKAILRRAVDEPAALVIRAGPLVVDLERYEAKVKGRSVPLSPKEFEFLKCLLQADGRALSRDELLEKVWGRDRSMEIDANTADQYIARLRGKLEDEAERIVTVKNVGYRIRTD